MSVAFCIGFLGACTEASDTKQPDGKIVRALHAELDLSELEAIPVPDADGPTLAPTALRVPVFSRPSRSANNIGYLRLGAKVPRSDNPVGYEECPSGWYAIRPVGFVCGEDEATTDLEHKLVRAVGVEPDRSRPMPYRYAFVRAVAPNYLRIPSKGEQFKREIRLERHLRNYKKLTKEWDKLEVGANDVPLDEQGRAIGKIPEHALPLNMSERFGGDGSDQVPWWLSEGKRAIPNIASFRAPAYAVMAGRVKRHAGVALIDSFVADKRARDRRFAVTVDARLIPADKLKADSGSPFHGESIRDVGLPVAFARKAGARWWRLAGSKLSRGDRLEWREFIPLNGKVKRVRGVRMVQARNGDWLRSSDLKTAPKPGKLPWFASGQRRWIQVSLISQTMILWEGARPVYATLVSTGRDGLADSKKTLSTPQGTFRIYQKHVTTTMDSDVADSEFELRDVPWVMYFKGGYALHGAYWHDDFGRPRSHGCINLSPIDARLTFNWSSPDVPEHWHGANSGETFDRGTLIHIVP